MTKSAKNEDSAMPHLVLLTAPKGAGKTTACERFLEHACKANMRVGGILTPARFSPTGEKTGIDAVDAFNGERHSLATLEPEVAQRTIGPYRFDPEVMQWALERVLRALAAPIDAVIIDEIGPLELIHQKGFAPALKELAFAQAASVILVVRVELLVRLQETLSSFQPLTITLTLANRVQVPMRLFEDLWRFLSGY